MRGKVTDQDLTDYALNTLPPEERLYVESILAVSEECRHDVYQMIEMSEMLREGFEMEENTDPLVLQESQRARVLDVPRWSWQGFAQRVAVVALLSACAAFAVTRPGLWERGGASGSFASAGAAVKDFVAEVHSNGFARTAEEFTARIQAAAVSVQPMAESAGEWQFAATPAVCTPPTWSDMPPLPEVVEM